MKNNCEIIYYNRGYAYVKLGKRDEALKDFSKSVEINKNFSPSYLRRGYIYFAQEKYNEAIEDYT